VELEADNKDFYLLQKISLKLQEFTTKSSIIMLLMIFAYGEEVSRFTENYVQRIYAPTTHGQLGSSYSSLSSLLPATLLFLANFRMFMFYF